MDLNEVRKELEGDSERMKMYSVVEYTNGEETSVSEAKPYQDAYTEYEARSLVINALDEKGNYKHPKKRVSLRAI